MNAESRFVVDANLIVKRFVDEAQSPQARRFLLTYREVVAPDFLMIEAGNTFLKKVRRGEMTDRAARIALETIPTFVQLQNTDSLYQAAWAIALRFDRSFYDALYVALAVDVDCQLITADERLVNAVHDYLGERVIWLGTLPV